MEHEVERVVGPRGRRDPDRGRAPSLRDRGGHAWRAPGRRQPAACAAEFGSRDLLERVALEQMLVGASARRYRRTQEPIGAEAEAAPGGQVGGLARVRDRDPRRSTSCSRGPSRESPEEG
jgi:putative transposase